jgi:hypothetical protein
MYIKLHNVKRDVLIRGVNDAVYRRAKASAASKGITLGQAVDEAFASWARDAETGNLEAEIEANREFVRLNWKKISSKNKGKAVVISGGQLRGVFPTYEGARSFASKKCKVALVFLIDKPPAEREIDFGAYLEV